MNARILLIENEPELRETLRDSLTRADYQVVSTTQETEMLALPRDESFHLIVLDVSAPELDGFSLCRALRA